MARRTAKQTKSKKATTSGDTQVTATPKSDRQIQSLLSGDDLHFFNEGKHYQLYQKLGAHPVTFNGQKGTYFAVWAPNAESVSVIGDFNGWNKGSHFLNRKENSGIWEGFIPGMDHGSLYKYHIRSQHNGYVVDKPDPVAAYYENAIRGASVVWDLKYDWNDQDWMQHRSGRHTLQSPISVYEVHIGSWMRVPEDGNRSLAYVELADRLTEYVKNHGFTHVEFLPVMEHPFFASWGYQTTGYFAPSSRYGTPQDFMYLVDRLHQAGIGVILDWAPSHFAKDEHGLGFFDGTHLYEHEDPRKGTHPDWDSLIFNYARHEVRSFLISSAISWLDRYHIDGLRVDAVASMLYLDYSRKEGEWIPNKFGGRENIEAVDLLRELNCEAYRMFPDILTVAEESTSWPRVSGPTYVGGLGFGYKWDMGWMHDTLDYFSTDPIYRKYHHDKLTFRMMYAYSENYMLPLSHDEVVHGKGSLINKMHGDDWQQFAGLRLLYGYMWGSVGKKLVFMGDEIGQRHEWNHDASIDWHLTEHDPHRKLQTWVSHLNDLYRREPAMHERDCEEGGFEWVDCHDQEASVLTFMRKGKSPDDVLLFAFNFTPTPRLNYRVGVPVDEQWDEILNSDAELYGGSGHGNMGHVEAAPLPRHNHPYSLTLTIPPLGMVILKPHRDVASSSDEQASESETSD